MGRTIPRKGIFSHLRKAKLQISLHIFWEHLCIQQNALLTLNMFTRIFRRRYFQILFIFFHKICFNINANCLLHITKTRQFKYTENFTTKNWKFSDKNSNTFHISAQNIDCGYSLEPPRRGGSNEYPQSRRGGSNEYPQSMFLSRNKKNNVYPCKAQFYYIKVGFKGVKII